MRDREYAGDPRVMVVAPNGAVSEELKDLCEAATLMTAAIASPTSASRSSFTRTMAFPSGCRD